jgi:proteasome lid subunit RPN8/RPN11
VSVDAGESSGGLATDDERGVVVLPSALHERLVAAVRERHPRKSFGYFVSDVGPSRPVDFLLFEENVRNDRAWRPDFEAYGRYFVEHGDAGFVATPEESWRIQREIWDRGLFEVGVFHSHQRHPTNFSRIDYDMHMDRFEDLWHLIISMRNPELPQIRVFGVARTGVTELEVRVA